jgi:nucleotide-binding universal stress UspA family protein
MYKKIYVPVDNSDHSNQAVTRAVDLARAFEAGIVGCHVYAAKMHDYRFRQMEYTLPDEYLEETELERQRKIHDSLITMGLQLVSDCYLEDLRKRCQEHQLAFEPKTMDGKHHTEIVRDIQQSDYDLVVLGALGVGRVRDSQIGSVCERVARTSAQDVWVTKRLPAENGAEPERDTILVGIDGSPQSFGALDTAIELARKLNKKVEAISVYDPYLHYSVFNGIVGVLTEKAAKVFRFEEQNQLHEEIIDTGLAQIYQSHLEVARKLALEKEVELATTLLDGKAFQKILDHVRRTDPFLVVLGRIGVHSPQGETALGSNTENLLRTLPCDVLLTTRTRIPELDLRAEEAIRWTPEAEQRMQRVPAMVQGIARTAIYRLAVERGHSVITSDVLDEAMNRYMPSSAANATLRLAEKLALDHARRQRISICKSCGVAAAEPEPVKCSVCSSTTFNVVTEEMLDRIAAMEGGAEVETAYDGKKLLWSQEAKRALWTMKDAYQRRRAKARVEKSARIRKLDTVTLEFARMIVEEETGVPLVLPTTGEENGESLGAGDLKLVARDDKRNPLVSAHEWAPEAIERLFRVPVGFMRQRTQARAEALLIETSLKRIELATVEQALDHGRQAMEEFIQNQAAEIAAANPTLKPAPQVKPLEAQSEPNAAADKPAGKCPWHNAAMDIVRNPDAAAAARDGLYLNEVGILSALEAEREQS